MTKERLAILIAAGIILVLIFGIIIFALFIKIPPENAAFLNDAKIVLFTWGTALISFYWGSSKSSADKTDLMNKDNAAP
jgi:hypothetical protein